MNIIRKHKLHKNFGTPLTAKELIFLGEMEHFLSLLKPYKSISSSKTIIYKNIFGAYLLSYNIFLKELTIVNFPFLIRDYNYTEKEGIEIITYFFKEKYNKDSAFRIDSIK